MVINDGDLATSISLKSKKNCKLYKYFKIHNYLTNKKWENPLPHIDIDTDIIAFLPYLVSPTDDEMSVLMKTYVCYYLCILMLQMLLILNR